MRGPIRDSAPCDERGGSRMNGCIDGEYAVVDATVYAAHAVLEIRNAKETARASSDLAERREGEKRWSCG